jgi:hypothetical protein
MPSGTCPPAHDMCTLAFTQVVPSICASILSSAYMGLMLDFVELYMRMTSRTNATGLAEAGVANLRQRTAK